MKITSINLYWPTLYDWGWSLVRYWKGSRLFSGRWMGGKNISLSKAQGTHGSSNTNPWRLQLRQGLVQESTQSIVVQRYPTCPEASRSRIPPASLQSYSKMNGCWRDIVIPVVFLTSQLSFPESLSNTSSAGTKVSPWPRARRTIGPLLVACNPWVYLAPQTRSKSEESRIENPLKFDSHGPTCAWAVPKQESRGKHVNDFCFMVVSRRNSRLIVSYMNSGIWKLVSWNLRGQVWINIWAMTPSGNTCPRNGFLPWSLQPPTTW